MTEQLARFDDLCDNIDAVMFTGDLLYTDPEALTLIKMYVARWQRGIASIDQFLMDEGKPT